MTPCRQLSPVIAALLFAASACSSNSSTDADASMGGTAPGTGGATGSGGGQATGGMPGTGGQLNTGGGTVASGGASPSGGVGGASVSGGATSGGAAGSGGIDATGGTPTGGTASGGTQSGGRSFGGFAGRASGGAETGGGATGGSATGGSATGGSATGGSATGGSATGGSATGGGSSGGASSGGASSGGSTGGGDATPSAGCGKAPTLTSGKRSIGSRSFILSIPQNYDNSQPHRLIFAFHWNGGTSEDIDGGGSSGAVWSYYGLRAQAGDSTIFVAPQGNNNGWANPGGQDLAFVDDMIELIEGDLCVDTTRLFALGFSYGGGMSYSIACARATVFRAVAVYSGAQLSGCDGGKDPIAYLGIHGISDGTCNISGGRSLRDTFVRNNGCTAQNPPEPAGGSLTHTCTKYEGCRAGYPVEWCAFDGGHTPGMVDGGGDDGAKTWTKEEVWRFFTQF
jgi:poly(3-hydroxybutyrate) depolymerase